MPGHHLVCTKLQSSLLQIVEDTTEAGIQVVLDILCLRVGMDINEFIREDIESSNAIFWIGTPGLKSHSNFKALVLQTTQQQLNLSTSNTKPRRILNNFTHFGCLVTVAGAAFPSVVDLNFHPLDFRQELEHYRHLPQLAAAALGVDHLPEFQARYNLYCEQTKRVEATFTPTAIHQRLEMTEDELKQQQVDTEAKLKELLAGIPDQMLRDLEGAEEAQQQTMQTKVLAMREHALVLSSTQLQSFYIPLKGGSKPDSPKESYFDVCKGDCLLVS
jgi:hypothetical protein